jgi:hypothetical protein
MAPNIAQLHRMLVELTERVGALEKSQNAYSGRNKYGDTERCGGLPQAWAEARKNGTLWRYI